MAKNGLISLLELKIVYNLFINKKGITIKEISTDLKTDYKNVHNAVEKLFKEGIIKKEKIGNYNICKLNFFNDEVIEYLKEHNFYVKLKEFGRKHPVEYNILKETVNKSLAETINSSSGKSILSDKWAFPFFFILVIFGSYSKNEERKGSDIDVLLISETRSVAQEIKNVLKKVNAPYQKTFHIETQVISEFIADLQKKNGVSIATELYASLPIAFHGGDIFFKIMVEANKLW